MKKIKGIIEDIWFNYRTPIIISLALSILLTIYIDTMDLVWYIVAMLIVNGVNIAALIYGLIRYFKNE